MGQYPEQLPEESDRAYDHFLAWLDFPARDRREGTKLFAVDRDIKPDQVRRLRSRYRWAERAEAIPTVEQALRERTTELTIERTAAKTAETVSDKIAAAKAANTVVLVTLANKAGKQALAAVDKLNAEGGEFDAKRAAFVVSALRALAQAEERAVPAQAVQINAAGEVSVEIDALHDLPAPEAARRARIIVDEAQRKARLLEEYYTADGAS
jgi:hypothetical protein